MKLSKIKSRREEKSWKRPTKVEESAELVGTQPIFSPYPANNNPITNSNNKNPKNLQKPY